MGAWSQYRCLPDRPFRAALVLAAAALALVLVLWLGLAGIRSWCFPAPLPGPSGLLAQRHADARLTGDPVETYLERRVELTSAPGPAHAPDFAAENFSLRLTGLLWLWWPGPCELGLESDDDGRLFVDGRLLVDNSGEHPPTRRTATVWLAPGRHLIEVEYANRSAGAYLRLLGGGPFRPAGTLPLASLAPPAREFSRARAESWGWSVRHQAAAWLTLWSLLTALSLWAALAPDAWRRARRRARLALADWRGRSAAAALARLWRGETGEPDPARASRRRREALVAAAALALALAFAHPVLDNPGMWGRADWDQHMFFLEVPRVSLLEYGQAPLWNPYYCGGSVMLANPQSRLASPSYILVLLAGTEAGVKLAVVLNLALGIWGAWRLGRWWGLDAWAAWLPGALYFLGGMFAGNLHAGMTWFLSVAWLPWAALFFLRGLAESPRFFVLAGACLALVFLEGGAYTLPMGLLLLGALALLHLRRAGLARILGGLALTGACLVLLAAVKLLPAYEFVSTHPRPLHDPSGYTWGLLGRALLDPGQAREERPALPAAREAGQAGGSNPHYVYDWDENALYVGYMGLGLFLLGLLTQGRRQWRLALLLGLFLWAALGSRVCPSLWEWLHQLPVLDAMRVAQRFRILFMLPLALLAGLGLAWLGRGAGAWLGRPAWGRAVEALLLAAVLADLWLVTHPQWRRTFSVPPVSAPAVERFEQVRRLPDYDERGWRPAQAAYQHPSTSLLPAVRAGLGVVEADESANVPRAAAWVGAPGYRGEVYLEGAEGEAVLTRWSPNRLEVAVEAREAGWLVLNQNYYPGWRAGALEMDERGGLLALRVEPGARAYELRYLPGSVALGAALSLLALGAGFFLFPWTEEGGGPSRREEGA